MRENQQPAADLHACGGAKRPATMRNGLRITVARWPCNAGQIAQRVRETSDVGRTICAWIQLAVGPQPLWLRNPNSGLAQRIMDVLEYTLLTSRCLAPTNFTGKSALQRLNGFGHIIRSTTGISIPSPVCTRKSTKVSRTESPCRNGRNKFRRRRRRGGEKRKGEIYKLRSFWDTASRGLATFVTPKPHFRTNPSDHGKASSNIAP
ncbi:hypothetical protein F511_36601 [Dorcoceras hygrometricum]|uniref:Uncharacterized protein n=1 Tax=Dorcoceras hygrometricum TaxID=472368 RepID=A0A2Z7BNM8_9LAMI|nr:hypothetical protein F511_36601 [Dorcoceras hygrometricum]